ncbi:MAG: SDR family NAD(P)-dependent oxidoreductase [Actinomycetota bacterium]|nr:SDR family NAD(P)-dependent oxidoreductase [Actinomycetota bacterium]
MAQERANGSVAVVTGAGGGIGRAVAQRLAHDGFAVACLDLDVTSAGETATTLHAAGARSIAEKLDVSDGDEVAGTFEAVSARLGTPAVLVHAAGILTFAPALDLAEQEWRHVLDVNLTGTFLCDQAAARLMAATGGGRIVNVASVHSVSPGSGVAHYDASKGGVAMLTKSLALELAAHHITVNAVAPGLIVGTNLVSGSNDEYLAEIVPRIPLQRAGQPSEVAGAVSYLCSPAAEYVTGAMLVIDGGMLLTART